MMRFGWIPRPEEVDRICMTLSMPLFTRGVPRGTRPVLLYKVYRKIAGHDDLGVQGIGDCPSWGGKHLVDYTQAIEIDRQTYVKNLFEMSASEVIYGLARVEVGGQRGSTQDGATGAWVAKAIHEYGTLSYKRLQELNYTGHYEAKRAKLWGATGLPDALEPVARRHTIATVSLVTCFDDAAHLIENGYGVMVCSNVGFGERVTHRDNQGFAEAEGTWNHCMFFSGVRYDHPGLCVINQWPKESFAGPLVLDQPANSFWVDEKTVNRMLGQRDSWTASGHRGYPLKPGVGDGC